MPPQIPILLLKSPSPTPPTDPYTTHLSTPSSPYKYTPRFIPVLTHTLLPDPLISLLLTHLSPPQPPFPYGALILTSQRAVAALSSALHSPPLKPRLTLLKELKLDIYTVGPATERALHGLRDEFLPECRIHGGSAAGSGELLAAMILGKREGYEGAKYTTLLPSSSTSDSTATKKPILFLTGSTRRDILPLTLTSPSLPPHERIPLDEKIVYTTTELPEFEFSFARILATTEPEEGGVRWVVVFSPTAGKGMLRALGWGDRGEGRGKGRRTFIACIGPTTGEYLERECGVRADVVAGKPSPEGVRDGIERFMRERGIFGSEEDTIPFEDGGNTQR